MKKNICIILTLIILLGTISPLSANATSSRILTIIPGLSINGTTAHCELTVGCDYLTDEISATVRLWEGNFCIATWTCSDTGSLGFYKTKTVTAGNTYTLTADVTINGVTKPRVSIKAS